MTAPKATPDDKLNWEVEKLRKEVRNLSRTFVTAVVLAIAGAVTAGYNIVKAFTDVSAFQVQRAKLSSEIAELKEQREVSAAELSSFRAEYQALRDDKSITPEQILERLPSIQPTLQYAAPDQVAHSSLPARVYVQHLNVEKAYADTVIQQLERSNYKVKSLGTDRTVRSRVPTVGYYYPADEDEAKKLIALLKQLGVKKVKEQPLKLEGSTRPRHFDLWLPKNDGS